MNRGSSESDPRRRDAPTSFNEAPIHESGKFPHGLRLNLAQGGFNEAPIHESGK